MESITWKKILPFNTRINIATDPIDPRMAASVITRLSRESRTIRAIDDWVTRSGQSMVGKCPSLNNRDTLSSTTIRHSGYLTEGLRFLNGIYSPDGPGAQGRTD